MPDTGPYDVIVVGAGNAALCAALAAREHGAKVLVLEKASEEERGGNSTFTAGGFRFVHHGVEDLRKDVLVDLSESEAGQMHIPPFTAEIYMDDLMKVTENLSDPELADLLVNRSRETVVWMRQKGVRWIPMFSRQSYMVNGVQTFFGGMAVEAVGGGWGLVDFLFRCQQKSFQSDRLGVSGSQFQASFQGCFGTANPAKAEFQFSHAFPSESKLG